MSKSELIREGYQVASKGIVSLNQVTEDLKAILEKVGSEASFETALLKINGNKIENAKGAIQHLEDVVEMLEELAQKEGVELNVTETIH